MVQYILNLATDDTPNPSYVNHQLDLTPAQEDDPDRLFDRAFQQKLRLILQDKTNCAINDTNLKTIVDAWLEDIREGYRLTSIAVNLMPLQFENIHRLNDPGERSPPDLFPPDLSTLAPQGGAFPPLLFD